MAEPHSHYVHGTDAQEQSRLSLLNDLLNQGSIRKLDLKGGERVLDLGCGLGQLSRAMARAASPGGLVVGVDRSDEQLAEGRRQAGADGEGDLVEFRSGDVLALDLPEDEWGTYDVAHARFILEHVPDPLAVTRSMVRAVKPGGRIVIEDEDHEILRLWPEPEGFRETWSAYIESYRIAGNDPHVGKRLVELLHAAGAEPRRNACIWFGSAAGDPLFGAWVTNLIGVLHGARTSVLATGRTDETRFDAALDAIHAWGGRTDAASWYFMAWAEGRRPAS